MNHINGKHSGRDLSLNTCWCGGTLQASVHPLYYQCELCGTHVIKQKHSSEQLQQFYTLSGYWHEHQIVDSGFPAIEDRATSDFNDRIPYWFELVQRYCAKQESLLEIGCAHGGFLSYCRAHGIQNVVGVEVDEKTCMFARERFQLPHVYSGLFPDVKLPMSSFTVITGFDVIEHFTDPIAGITAITNYLSDDGTFIFQTPCYRGEAYAWPQFRPIEHVFLYNESSIKKLFITCGLEITDILPGYYPDDMFVIGHKAHRKKKIIFLRPDSIGDNILAASMLPYIQEKYAKAHITVVCQEHIAELYESCPHVDSIVTIPQEHKWSSSQEYDKFLSSIRTLDPDILLNSTYSLHVLSDLAGLEFIPTRVAFRQGDKATYTDLVPSPDPWLPELGKHTAFLQGLGVHASTLSPRVWLTSDDHDFADRFLRENALMHDKPVIVCPGARTHHRMYPIQQYANALNAVFADQRVTFLLIGGNNDVEITSELSRYLHNPTVNLAGKTTLRQTAALIQRSRLYVGAETASAHMACAVGTPNVVLLGGGHFGRFMPYSSLTTTVCLPLDCYHCDWKCRYDNIYCIQEIPQYLLAMAITRALEKQADSIRVYFPSNSMIIPLENGPHWDASKLTQGIDADYVQIHEQQLSSVQQEAAIADMCLSAKPRSSCFTYRNNYPRISIVSPSFNQAQYLEECIESILNQNYPNLEYIIMDGGSTDGSVDIIKKYEKHLAYWQSQPDGGQYQAINEGFRRSTGEIMAWLNSDDKYHPGALHQVELAFRAMPQAEWITGRPTAWNAQGKLVTVFDHVPSWTPERLLYPEENDYYIQQESTFWRRSLWDKAGGRLDEDWPLAADFELWCRFFHYSQLVGVDALLGGFRYHSAQKTASLMNRYKQEVHHIIERERHLIGQSEKSYQSPPTTISMDEIIMATAPVLSPEAFSYFSYSRRPHFSWFDNAANILFDSSIDLDFCDLKMYQDLLCYTFIIDNIPKGSRILEIGGGDSRVLKAIRDDYECWNIDKLEGLGNGLTDVTAVGYRFVRAYMGEFCPELPEEYFDFVFSISALEHVAESEENFQNICQDIDRIMKPEAYSLHCFDVVAGRGTTWTNQILPYMFNRYETFNRFVPFEQMSLDFSLYTMSEYAYNSGWKHITQKNYQDFGKPLSYNILWQKPHFASYAVPKEPVKNPIENIINVNEQKLIDSVKNSQKVSNIVVATSIVTKNIDPQKSAVISWLHHGFKVISVNTASEIAILKPNFPEVTFVEAGRDARETMGRPLIFFDDILAALAKSNARVCGIINSDIHLIADDGFSEYIASQALYSFIIGHRVDVENFDTLAGEFYQSGFDIFFFDRYLIEAFPTTDFCLGATWWDIWAPLAMTLKGVQLKQLITPVAYHCIHENRWSKKEWLENCDRVSNAINQINFDLSGHSYLVCAINEQLKVQNFQGFFSVLRSFLLSRARRIDFTKTSQNAELALYSPSEGPLTFESKCYLPLFSVITPSYNQGKYIEETIRSVLAQKNSNFEHIVIDGGSTDCTIQVLQKYPHLKWTSEKDNGQSDAFNKGFRKATGEIIAWINSDDWYEPDVFSNVAAFFAENPEKNIVMGNCNLVDEKENIFDTVVNSERGLDELSKYWIPQSIPTQPAIFFRKCLLDRYGLLDETLHYAMDYDLWMRIAKDNRFYHLDRTVANYRFHNAAKGGDQDWNKFVPEWKTVFNRYTSPRVSVVIPCYNYAHYLTDAVSSVIGQTFQDFEIIIVNDGSTDNTIEVAEKLITSLPSHTVKLITTPNSGNPAFPRNIGVRESRGSYILFLDADDMLMPTFLKECVKVLDKTASVSIVYTDQIYFDEKRSWGVPTCDYDFGKLLNANLMAYCSLFRRKVWDDAGGVPTDVGYEDWDLWIMSGLQGHYAQRIPKPLFCYRQHETGRFKNDLVLRDQYLKAQIVLKHRDVYPAESVHLAEKTISMVSNVHPFRVIAIISAHNEGDVIYHVIGDLIQQGVEVYLINHCSTDNTVVEASRWLGKGLLHIENFPEDAGYPVENASEYIWRHILARKEQLAAQLDADWFIHADADEFRESPWVGMSLAEAIRHVDALGYNAIDFELLNFRPTDNRFVPGTDVRPSMPYFDGYEKYDALQIKAWKNLKIPANIVGTAGHDISFAGRRVFPVKFLLRHYPVRSQEHGLRKVFEERKKRFNSQERADQWHIQYDTVINTTHNFIRDPKTLTCYDPQAVRDQLFLYAPKFRMDQSLESQPVVGTSVPVSIIIPVFNQVNFTAHCLETLYATTPASLGFEVIVVDNASTDETAAFLIKAASHYPNLRIISNPENLMFSGGCNCGAMVAKGNYLLFLNNDTEPHSGWLEPLIGMADADETIGVIGSKLIFPDETIQHAGIVVGQRDGDPYPYHVHLGVPATSACVNEAREYQMVTGACLLIRNELFNRVGGFDECFINGHEDLDLCLKARKAGFRVMYCPDSVVTHFESRTKQLLGMNNFMYQKGVDNEEGRGRRRFLEIWRSYLVIDDQPTAGNSSSISTQNVQKKGLKILFTMYGWNETGGGTTFPKAVTQELVKRGYEIAVFYASLACDQLMPAYSMSKTVENGVTLYGVYNRPAQFIDPDNPEREIYDADIADKFRQVLDEVKPNLVHYNNFHGLTFAIAEEIQRRGIPSCFTPHNYHLIDPNLYLFNSDLSLWNGTDLLNNSEAVKNNPTKREWYQERVATTRKLLNEWVGLTLAVSSRQRELLIQHGARPERIAVVHQANKSTDALWKNELLAREGGRELHAPLNIGFIGGVMPQKGVHMLVAAAQFFEPSEVKFHVYGFAIPEYLCELTKLDRKNVVNFHGEYSQAQLGGIAQGLDVAVVPSVWEDCAPLVVLELHVMRLPVIAARIGGIPDFITEGVDGLLYDPFNLKALVGAIRTCLENRSLVTSMRRNLSTPSHTFSRYMEHLEKVYAVLLSGQKPDSTALSLILSRREAAAVTNKVSIAWHGALFAQHSLAHVNCELCLQLLGRGYHISFNSTQPDEFTSSVDPRFEALESIRNAPLAVTDIHIRHQWPPDFTPPASGHWIMIQPWEYGSLPRVWIEKMTASLDELWVPSSFVRDCYISSGLPEERVHVVPNGVDVANFNPDAPPLTISSSKRFRFLFVGGTIYRKGIDLLLAAYRAAFSINDDVCLVIKDMGGGSFYKGQTAQEMIQRFQSDPQAPEIEYLDFNIAQNELPGLYTACHCLVHPYRGEGFGLPIAEAMACGLAPIVTGYGAALDFCPPECAWLIPAKIAKLPIKQIGDLETVDFPWFAEPDLEMLTTLMRYAAEHPQEATDLGAYASSYIRKNFTWEHAADRADERLRALANKPVKRLVASASEIRHEFVSSTVPPEVIRTLNPGKHIGIHDRLAEAGTHSVSLCMIVKNEEMNLPACLASLKPVVDEMIVVDTGSTDRTTEIATAFGARVYNFAWNGNFSDARNHALSKAKGSWILVMDADEVLSARDYEVFRSVVAQSNRKQVAWAVTTRNYMSDSMQHDWTANAGEYPREERGIGWCPSPKTRLFPRNKRIRFEGHVHEVVEHSLKRLKIPVHHAPFVVHHYGHMNKSGMGSKKQYYYELAKKKLLSRPNDTGVLAELAIQAGEIGRFEEALELWDRVLKIQLNDKQAHFNRSHVLNHLKRYPESIGAAKRALKIDPSMKEAAFYYATGELYAGDLTQAETELLRILAIHHEYPPALALLAVVRLCRGDSDAAKDFLQPLKQINFGISNFIIDCIHKLADVMRTDLARSLLQLSLQIGCLPQEALAELDRFTVPQDPAELAEVPVKIDHDETELRSGIVNSAIAEAYRLAMRGETDRAVEELLQKGIRVSPDDPAPYLALVDILQSNGRYQDALQVIPEMPQTTPAASILALQAVCQEGMGEYDLARQSADAALNKEPDNWRSLNVLGLIARRNGTPDIAAEYFERSMKADPHAGEPAANRGIIWWEAGNKQLGYELLQRAAHLALLDEVIFRRYRAAAVLLGRANEAAALFRGKHSQYPESRLLVTSLVETLITQGKTSEALNLLLEALSTLGTDEELFAAALELRRQVGPRKPLVGGEPHSVSLCMIVKNEGANLPRCLASVMPVVQEMVIVDTGSSDRTVDIATAFGAQIHNFSWTGSFSDARNFALSKARGQWILVMDADEMFSAQDHEKLCQTVSSSVRNEAWSIIIRNYSERVNVQGWTVNDGLYPREEQADGWYPAQRVKLFPNDPRFRFTGEVHELVEPSLRRAGVVIRTASFTVHHYGELYGLPEELANKQRRYFDLGKQKLEERPNDVIALTELAVQAGELELFDEALTLWDRVLALQPDRVEAFFNKSYALIGLKRYQEGLDASRQALEHDPDHKEAAFNYGTCELYAGEPARALPILEPLLEQYPEYPPLLAVMMLLLILSGQQQHAALVYSKLKALHYAIEDYARDRIQVLTSLGKKLQVEDLLNGCTDIGINIRDQIVSQTEIKSKAR